MNFLSLDHTDLVQFTLTGNNYQGGSGKYRVSVTSNYSSSDFNPFSAGQDVYFFFTPVGVQGIDGALTATGDQGSQGPQGKQGVQGESGENFGQGSQGPRGDRGFQGFSGPQGSQGIQGDAGANANQGPQGVQGGTGANLYTITSSTLDPSAATGSTGDLWIKYTP